MYPHTKTEQLLLGVRKRSFAYTRKVVWANANGCEKASRSLRIGFLYLACLLRAPCLLTSEQPSAYFRLQTTLFPMNSVLVDDVFKDHIGTFVGTHQLELYVLQM